MSEQEPLHRLVRTDDIPPEGLKGVIVADETERHAIAKLLDLVGLSRLAFGYQLERHGRGRIGLKGHLQAELTQTCVVSLELLQTAIEEDVEAEFWPETQIAELDVLMEEPPEHRTLDWPEPISEGKIDLGPFIYETLATAIDPYPRKEGAVLEWHEEAPAGRQEKEESPFAVLSRLKNR